MRTLCLLAGLALIGCVDPGGEYEAFIERLPERPQDRDAGPRNRDAGACQPSAVAGEYRLSLSVVIAPTRPIVAAVTVEATDDPPTLTLSRIQPLSAADRTTPVGSSFAAGPFDVVNGSTVVSVPDLEVTGAANPITGGDIAADVALRFDVCDSTPYLCGDVTGSVTQPLQLDLEGSTFAMTPLDPPTEPLPIDCDGNFAEPL